MSVESRLMRLKESIDEAKDNLAQSKGRLKNYMEQLKSDFNCSTLKQAEAKMKSLKKEIEKLEKQIETDLDELEEIHE